MNILNVVKIQSIGQLTRNLGTNLMFTQYDQIVLSIDWFTCPTTIVRFYVPTRLFIFGNVI